MFLRTNLVKTQDPGIVCYKTPATPDGRQVFGDSRSFVHMTEAPMPIHHRQLKVLFCSQRPPSRLSGDKCQKSSEIVYENPSFLFPRGNPSRPAVNLPPRRTTAPVKWQQTDTSRGRDDIFTGVTFPPLDQGCLPCHCFSNKELDSSSHRRSSLL